MKLITVSPLRFHYSFTAIRRRLFSRSYVYMKLKDYQTCQGIL